MAMLSSENSSFAVPLIDGSVSFSNGTEACFFYHGDHLGSNSFTSDSEGLVHDRTLYFPYGEVWIEEGGNEDKDLLGFKFTSKEFDDETGYYYFGARYYEPQTARWVSTDPKLKKYIDGGREVNSGVFYSFNLALYSYSYTNPVRYYDPDGRQPDLNRFTTLERILNGAPWDVPKTVGRGRTNLNLRKQRTMHNLSSFYAGRSRYIYTEGRGPIDLRHFFAAAESALGSDAEHAESLGRAMEVAQSLLPEDTAWGASAYDYEDLISNELGAQFGEILKNSEIKTADDMKEAFSNFFQGLEPKEDVPDELRPHINDVPDSETTYPGNPLRELFNQQQTETPDN